ncbi:MAG: 4Fe-4S binding protein [candidate division Zixibacteria bacterium]|nr:4Fe-4S binding protein [candidate division Zixibacteria bacterium]
MNRLQIQEQPITEQLPLLKSTRSKLVTWLADNVRLMVQISFALLVVWIGIEFHFFIEYLESGGVTGDAYRPPGVEGFLPISSLMSLYYWLLTGNIHAVHPAGMFILLGVIMISLVFGKSFCSWLCPVGFLSEVLGDLGDKIFGRRLRLPRWLDYPLRSIKYLLLGFFVYSIFFLMTAASLEAFLYSLYNIVADIKMYYFFADISRFSLIVIGVLFLLSIVIRNFWCRYLCPYGALLGVVSLLSLHKIKRNVASCTDCGLCAQVCPSSIKVDKVKTVISDECTACLSCVDVCPVKNTLELTLAGTKKVVSRKQVAVGVVGLFMLITGLAMLTGNWQNKVTIEEYLQYYKNYDSYGHPTSGDDIVELNKEVEQGPQEP